MRFILYLGLTILLSSCVTTTTNYYPQTVQSWRGGNVNNLIRQWGAPDRTISSPNGNTLYLYQTQSYRHLNAPSSPWNRGAMSSTCVATFEVARNGKILNTKIRGNNCYGNEHFAKRLSNPASKQ